MQVKLQVSSEDHACFNKTDTTFHDFHHDNHMFLQGNPGMPSGHIPVYCLCILPHNAHQFPGATSDHLNMYVSIIIMKTSKGPFKTIVLPSTLPLSTLKLGDVTHLLAPPAHGEAFDQVSVSDLNFHQ